MCGHLYTATCRETRTAVVYNRIILCPPPMFKTVFKVIVCVLLIWDNACESYRLVQSQCSRKWRQCWTCSCKLAASCLCSQLMAATLRHHSCVRHWWTGWLGFWTTSHSWSCWTLQMWHLWPTCRPCTARWTVRLEQFDVLEDRWCSRTRTALCHTRQHTVHRLSTWYVFVALLFERVYTKMTNFRFDQSGPQLHPKTAHWHVQNVLVCGPFWLFSVWSSELVVDLWWMLWYILEIICNIFIAKNI